MVSVISNINRKTGAAFFPPTSLTFRDATDVDKQHGAELAQLAERAGVALRMASHWLAGYTRRRNPDTG
jgi:hypothetical protein